MEADFWHQRWENNQIGFHEPEPNALLVQYWPTLNISPGSRVLVPLCGKSHDVTWLANQGYHVVGVELNKLAVEAYFESIGKTPSITKHSEFSHYHCDHIDIFQGDFFATNPSLLGTIDAVYDRAAIVALPPEMRVRYAQHLNSVTNHAKQLVISYEYDQSVMQGPPFSVTEPELRSFYQDIYNIKMLATDSIELKVEGNQALEKVWQLS